MPRLLTTILRTSIASPHHWFLYTYHTRTASLPPSRSVFRHVNVLKSTPAIGFAPVKKLSDCNRRKMTQSDEVYIGSIDQGTTSTRFLIFDKLGEPVATHQEEFKQIHPRPGYVDHRE